MAQTYRQVQSKPRLQKNAVHQKGAREGEQLKPVRYKQTLRQFIAIGVFITGTTGRFPSRGMTMQRGHSDQSRNKLRSDYFNLLSVCLTYVPNLYF